MKILKSIFTVATAVRIRISWTHPGTSNKSCGIIGLVIIMKLSRWRLLI